MKKITTPFTTETIENLQVGEEILLSGEIFTARDAAHKRVCEMLDCGLPLPFEISGQVVYYTGPCPAPPDKIIGSVGPTTSARMDAYAPRLIRAGLRVMIGKGARNSAVVSAIREHKGLYLAAVGGAGALLSLCVERAELIAFEDLGAEAVYKLTVRDMPLVVAVDCGGAELMRNITISGV
ncbi:MAG: FumA C-terminus/TtdB family hydratase beta subunit [Oscillospiraceae bacterium]|nr:FumA C-terminus/TtdB family hydratase beta subunit [Oscillospiraceae bacterium]